MEEEKLVNVKEEIRTIKEEKDTVVMEEGQTLNVKKAQRVKVEEEKLTGESQPKTEEANASLVGNTEEQESSLKPKRKKCKKTRSSGPAKVRAYWLKKLGISTNEDSIIAQSKKKPIIWKKEFNAGLRALEKMKRQLSPLEKKFLGLQEPKLRKHVVNDIEGSINESIIKIGICSRLFPTVVFSTFQLKVIQETILFKIVERKRKSLKFAGTSVRSGYLVYSCIGIATANWLREVIKQMAEWGGVDLKTIEQEELPSKTVLIGYFRPTKKESCKKILSYVGAQNEGLNVKGWKLVRRQRRKSSLELTFMVDPLSHEQLKKFNYKINFKFHQITLVPTSKTRKFLGNFQKNIQNPTDSFGSASCSNIELSDPVASEDETGSGGHLSHQQQVNSPILGSHVVLEESKCIAISGSDQEMSVTSNIDSNQWENRPAASRSDQPVERSFTCWKEHTNVETKNESWEGETLDTLVNSNPVHQFENVMTQGQWTNTWNENPHFETGNTRMQGRTSGNSAASDYQETVRPTLESQYQKSDEKCPDSGEVSGKSNQIPEANDNWTLSAVSPQSQDARDGWVPIRRSHIRTFYRNPFYQPPENLPEDSPLFRESRPPFRSDDGETTHQGPGASRGGSYREFRGRGPRRGRSPFRGVSSGRGFPRECKPMEWFLSNSSRPIRGTSRGPRGGGRFY